VSPCYVPVANKADELEEEPDYDELEEERISLVNASVFSHWMQNKESEVECEGKSIQLVSSYSS
jgi:hypothetical protein